jgi:hypothetical protein
LPVKSGTMRIHPELKGVLTFKIESARQSLRDMGEALQPRYHDPRYAVLESTGAVHTPWHSDKFWKSLADFMATIRSIPDVIQSWCGDYRQKNERWFLRLSADEKKRRALFQAKFKHHYETFSKLPLSRARIVTLHTKGIPPVDVIVHGRHGKLHKGGPTKPLPISEFQPIRAGNDPGLQFAATQPPLTVRPKLDDFRRRTSSGKRARTTLRTDCLRYLQKAQELITRAEGIYNRIHGDSTLTPPPNVRE